MGPCVPGTDVASPLWSRFFGAASRPLARHGSIGLAEAKPVGSIAAKWLELDGRLIGSAPSATTSMRGVRHDDDDFKITGRVPRLVRAHKGLVDLDSVEGKTMQNRRCGNGRCTKSSSDSPSAELAEWRSQHRAGMFRTSLTSRFGQLQLQRARATVEATARWE